MIAKLVLGATIAAAAISTAAPAWAGPDNSFSQLCVEGQCSTPAPGAAPYRDTSQAKADLQRGLHDALSPRG
jgi:hypothetical protein